MKSILTAGIVLLLGGSVQAQGVNGFQSLRPVAASGDATGITNFYIDAPSRFFPASGYLVATIPTATPNGLSFEEGVFNQRPISLDQFASTQQLQQQQARQEQFAFFMRRDFDRLSQGIALASALTIMPPNPGDRFAVTVGGAGFDGRGAGAISGTYRVHEDILVFGGYARSETQNLVKGGATFSFR